VEESTRRFEAFKENIKIIDAHNSKPDASFLLGVNEFADMTHEEFVKSRLTNVQQYKYNADVKSSPASQAPPASLDWRASTDPIVVEDVRNSGQCGSSAATTIVDSISADYAVASGEDVVTLDPAFVTDCDGQGCSGGPQSVIWTFIQKFGVNWYYVACPTGPGLGLCISGYNCTQAGAEGDLLHAVANIGPISVNIDASHSSFQLYKSGVYYEPACSSTTLDHSVLIVGYGSTNGQDYWIARNSWGTAWGMKGDILLARNKNNNCGVATSACYARNVHTCVCTL